MVALFRNVLVPVLCCAVLTFAACAHPPAPQKTPTVAEGAEAFLAQGHVALKRGDSIRAEQYFVLALENNVPAEKVIGPLLRSCLSSARLRAALNYAEPYLRDHPDADSLRYLVATIQLSLGQRQAATRGAKTLLYRNPDFADGHYLLGVLSGSNGEDARRHFESYLALAPHGSHSGEIENYLAELSVREGEP